MLDEMDGKQARRTGNSSPLGLLFDHGCDCFAAGIQPIIFMRVLQSGDNFLGLVFFVAIYGSFHFATLNEYYMGTLYLPVCNGVSDGSAVIIIGLIVTGIIGPEVWTIEVFNGSWLQIEGIQILTIGQLMTLYTAGLNLTTIVY
jgi:ethanolaminephosphotransferase